MGEQYGAWSPTQKQLIAIDFVLDYTEELPTVIQKTTHKKAGRGQLVETVSYGLEAVSVTVRQHNDNGSTSELLSLFFHDDRQGSIDFLSENTGAVLSYTKLDDWGQPVARTKMSVGGETFAFSTYTGHPYDEVIGLFYARARMYDATNRRWMAEDPSKNGLNWYVYVGDNPINYWDPTGLVAVSINGQRVNTTEIDGRHYADIDEIIEALGGTGRTHEFNIEPGYPLVSWDLPGYNTYVDYYGDRLDVGGTNANRSNWIIYIGPHLYGQTSFWVMAEVSYFAQLICPDIDVSQIDGTSDQLFDFLETLGFLESRDDYGAKNSFNMMGRYQIGYDGLVDIGFMDVNNNYTALANSYGVYSNETFLNNVTAQEVAVRLVMKQNWVYLRNYGDLKYIGTKMNDVEITASGLLGAAHLVGIGNLHSALSRKDLTSAKDGNGVTALQYMILLGGYNLSEFQV